MGNVYSLFKETSKKQADFQFDTFFDVGLDYLAIAHDKKFVRVNSLFYDFLGVGDEVYKKDIVDFVHPDDISKTVQELENLGKGQSTVSFINRYKCISDDSKYKVISWKVYPLNGMMYAIGRDVSDDFKIKQNDFLLSEAERLGDIGHWCLNVDTQEIFLSDGFREIYNIQGEVTFVKFMEKNNISIQQKILKCIETKDDFESEHRFEPNVGEVKFMYTKGRYIVNNMGNYIMGVGQDITKYKVIEENLMKARDVAESASAMKSAFVANMSHEIRTPINGIIGMTTLLKNTELNSEQKEFVETITASSGLLLSIINNVLDFSKIEAGKIVIEYTEVAIKDIVTTVSALFEHMCTEKGLIFKVYISPDVPKIIRCDYIKIQQILTNLINNAVKFTDFGSIFIVIKLVESQNALRFEIRDTGIGISENNQKTLFKPFEQADKSITRIYGGTGLGLSICRSLVLSMNGDIGILSNADIGTTVWFSIPILYLENNMIAAGNEKDLNENIETKNDLIIIVEDNTVNQYVIRKMLEKIGYTELLIYNNGVEMIVNKDKCSRAKLILMDIHMPKMDGYTCTKQLRECNVECPIIAVTANCMQGEREKCESFGMNDFLLKPIDFQELKKLMKRHSSSSSSSSS